MATRLTPKYLDGLVTELRKLPGETGWVEFKVNQADPSEIGPYISALSNAAALAGEAHGYVVWGIDDGTHAPVGTGFRWDRKKVGNEALENWLVRQITPRLDIQFATFEYHGVTLVVLRIPRASDRPTQFKGDEYIRVGSYRQKLRDHPQLARRLWRVFDTTPFEHGIAAERLAGDDALKLLDYSVYFDLLSIPLPTDRNGLLARLAEDRLIVANRAGGWDVTNLGAALFARNLNQYAGLGRKALRIVVYRGAGRLVTEREYVSPRGYGAGFEALIEYINALLPKNEVIGQALRQDAPMYPEPAVREVVANALIHQDFSVTGAGPMVEIFDDRLEVTNPGEPLVDTNRFLDTPPRSRNEALASLMRRLGICEERGSGIDKIVFQTELYQLPAPSFERPPGSTRAVLFAHKPFASMSRADRVRACYLHACLRYVQGSTMTNSSLRERFGIEPRNSAIASRIIRDTIDENLAMPSDPDQGRRHAQYGTYWA